LGPDLEPESELDLELELDDGGDLELKFLTGKKGKYPRLELLNVRRVHCYSLKSPAPAVVTVSIDQ
jgi:hypothetical protein